MYLEIVCLESKSSKEVGETIKTRKGFLKNLTPKEVLLWNSLKV